MQYDDCANRPDYNPLVYALICVSCVLTALCTTVNANLVKTSTLPLHVQNGLLYIGGFTINCPLFRHIAVRPIVFCASSDSFSIASMALGSIHCDCKPILLFSLVPLLSRFKC